jgi:pimeloyl-ACP methyl ester carboxylesterase
MTGARRWVRLILVFYISACISRASAGAAADPFVTGKVIDTVICKADPTQSYALYIPARGNRGALPVIFFFDPHANGALPLKKYQSLAEAYGFILIGSNNSKNGNDWPATENIWRHLSADVQARLRINGNRIYACGFSGGAKVAGYVALQHHEVKGVIANGAGLPDGVPAGDLSFSFTAMAGEGDMNLTELISISNDLDKSRTRHYMIIFDGKHEWAPVNSMDIAWAGLQFDAMRMGLLPRDNGLISRYIIKSKQRLDLYAKSNQLIKAGREYKLSLRFLDGLGSIDEAGWFRERAASLAGNALYRKQEQAEERLLEKEENTKAEYMQHFQQGDMSYWVRTIDELKVRGNERNDEKGMYQRLLAYLSLAFYSISNHLINGNANSEARHFVDLYKMADPGNSEAWYFSAILHAREGHVSAVEGDLLKAVENGFRDVTRLRQQPEFRELSTRIHISAIERKMREPVKGN